MFSYLVFKCDEEKSLVITLQRYKESDITHGLGDTIVADKSMPEPNPETKLHSWWYVIIPHGFTEFSFSFIIVAGMYILYKSMNHGLKLDMEEVFLGQDWLWDTCLMDILPMTWLVISIICKVFWFVYIFKSEKMAGNLNLYPFL